MEIDLKVKERAIKFLSVKKDFVHVLFCVNSEYLITMVIDTHWMTLQVLTNLFTFFSIYSALKLHFCKYLQSG